MPIYCVYILSQMYREMLIKYANLTFVLMMQRHLSGCKRLTLAVNQYDFNIELYLLQGFL